MKEQDWLARSVSDAIEDSGRSARDIAMAAGVSPSALTRYARGTRTQMRSGGLAKVLAELGKREGVERAIGLPSPPPAE